MESKKDILQLRAHHLLCTVLYTGHGYSEAFTANMDKAVKRLRSGCRVEIVSRPDAICGSCPNRKPDGGCTLDDNRLQASDSSPGFETAGSATVRGLDGEVVEFFDIRTDTQYCSSDLFTGVRDKMTEEFFLKACGSCRWYRAGYCSYEQYMKSVAAFINRLPDSPRL